MHEKRGKTFTDTQKTKIRAVAKTEGWRAGRSALSAAIKRTKGQKKSVEKKPAEAPKPKGGAEVARKSTPKRRVVAPKARKGVAIAPKATQAAEKTGGKTIEQIIKQAEHANNNIIVLWKDYQEKETAIDKKYEKELAGGISSGSLKEQSERVRTRMDSTPEYKKEIQSLEKETLAKLNKQKQKRDVLLKTALKSFGYKDKQLDSVNNQVANAREQMGNYRAVKTPEFQPTDLTQGVRENQFFFSTAMRQLKARAKAKRI